MERQPNNTTVNPDLIPPNLKRFSDPADLHRANCAVEMSLQRIFRSKIPLLNLQIGTIPRDCLHPSFAERPDRSFRVNHSRSYGTYNLKPSFSPLYIKNARLLQFRCGVGYTINKTSLLVAESLGFVGLGEFH